MSKFAAQPIIPDDREDPEVLTSRLRAVAETLPSTTGKKPARPLPVAPVNTQPASYQMGFRASPNMARVLAKLSEPQGGLRRWIAQVLHDQGHDIGAEDLIPPRTRRSFD